MTQLNINQVAQLAHQAGFNGQALTWITAIAMRESGGKTDAYNGNVATGDNSVGEVQENILGSNAANISRILGTLGVNVAPGDHAGLVVALSDPLTNFRVAYKLSNGGTNFEPWRSNSPGWSGPQGFLTKTDVPAAAAAAAQVQMGKISAATTAASQIPAATNATSQLVNWLQTQALGKPYQAGTVGPNAFDCSGLVTAAYKTLGISLPPLTFSQVKYGAPVSAGQYQPGDLLFFHGSQGDLGHVGVYIGDGKYIQAPHTGAVVMVSTLDPSKVQQARRIVDGNGRIITGAGMTPQHDASVGTVDASVASAGAVASNGVSMDPLGQLGSWGTLNVGTGTTPNGMTWGTRGTTGAVSAIPTGTFGTYTPPVATTDATDTGTTEPTDQTGATETADATKKVTAGV